MTLESLSNEMTDLINTLYAMGDLLEEEPSDEKGRARVLLMGAIEQIVSAQEILDRLY